jgi:hypothetical protein
MNQEQLKKFKQFVEKYTKKHTETPEAAERCLIKEGILDEEGNLKPEFGG